MTFPSPGADWPKIDAYLKGLGVRIDVPTLGTTEGGGHVPGSEHYQHRARDYGINNCDAYAVARALQPLAHGKGYIIDELFFSPLSIWYADGVAYVPGPRAIERVNHFSHCHAGCVRGAVFPAVQGGAPTPQPAPPPIQEDDVPLHVAHSPEDQTGARWLTDGITRRWLATAADVAFWVPKTPSHTDESWPIGILGAVPTVGRTP